MMKNGFLSTFILFFWALTSLFAQNDATTDKSLSPFFVVKNAKTNVDALPLKSTTADVKIAGMIADVTVRQTYENKGTTPLECIYVFPASTRAAVYAMQMKVGNRIINARIREKKQARREYEQAKAEGKRTSLLEQDRPNVFTMNVANILPNDVVEVTMQYTEMLIPTEGVYQFVYPTVVGPRYDNMQEKPVANHDFAATKYTPKGTAPSYAFDIKIALTTGVVLQNVACQTHAVDIAKRDNYHVDIRLKLEDTQRGNKDFVLNYQLRGDQFQSGVMLYEHNDENFFLAMIQPPKSVEKSQIPPREYVFVVDVSGSMTGFPLEVSKKLLANLVGNLKKTDYFNIIFFAGGSSILANKSLTATPDNIRLALKRMEGEWGSGGTELMPALQQALALPRPDKELSRSFILITDGYITVERECFQLMRNNLGKANIFSFGIGSGVNRLLIEGMAHTGQGEPFIVLDEKEAPKIAEKFRKYVNTPVLSQVKYTMEGFQAYDIEPLQLPDVMAERPILLFGKYKGKPSGSITIEGYAGKKWVKQTINVGQNTADMQNSALRYLWAREKLRYMTDFGQDGSNDSSDIKKIVDLGLKYNLLTAHTSFVAVDETPVNTANLKTVKQALPLPEGVEETAVGADISFEEVFEMGSRVAYELWIGLGVALAAILVFIRLRIRI